MPALLEGARRLAPHRIHLFVLHESRFLDPLVPEHWRCLARDESATAASTVHVAAEVLPARLSDLRSGIYFPVPLGRDLEKGGSLDELLLRYHYDLVEVDDDRVWWWRGRQVATRTQSFFLEHLAWEPAVQRYYFEYRVHDHWWDKCYLDCRTTPIVARTLRLEHGEIRAELNNAKSDRVDPGSFRLDLRERLLCRTRSHGEVALSDWLRFKLLRGLSSDGQSLRLSTEGSGVEAQGTTVPVAWPEGTTSIHQPEH